MNVSRWISSPRRLSAAGIEVANNLDGGYLEKVYERALLRELRLPVDFGQCAGSSSSLQRRVRRRVFRRPASRWPVDHRTEMRRTVQ